MESPIKEQLQTSSLPRIRHPEISSLITIEENFPSVDANHLRRISDAILIKEKKLKGDKFDKIINDKICQRSETLQKLLEDEEYLKAKAELHRLLFLKPNDRDFLIHLSHVYEKLEDYDKSVMYLKKAQLIKTDFKLEKSLNALLILKGNKMIQNSEFDGHVEILTSEKANFDPELETLTLSMKDVLGSGIINEADSIILEKQSPGHDNFVKALVYVSENKKKEAIKELDQCTNIDLKYTYAFILKAKLYWSLKCYKPAYQEYWNAYNIDPDNPEIKEFLKIVKEKTQLYYNNAMKFYLEKDYEKSLYFIQKGLHVDEENNKFYLLRFYIRRKTKDFQNAIKDIENAAKYMRDSHSERKEIAKQLALLYNEMGIEKMVEEKYEEAIRLFDEALKFKRDDWGIIVNKGDCHRNLKRYDDAINQYKEATIFSKRNEAIMKRIAICHFVKALDHFNAKQYTSSLVEIKKALDNHDTNAFYYALQGRAYGMMKDSGNAYCSFKKAFEFDRENPEFINLLAQFKSPEELEKKTFPLILMTPTKKSKPHSRSLSNVTPLSQASMLKNFGLTQGGKPSLPRISVSPIRTRHFANKTSTS